MTGDLIDLVWKRARRRGEYCQIPQWADNFTCEIDHIIARKHRGATVASNLCRSCWHCNMFKGSDISSIDPQTGKLTALDHPRRQRWGRHFRWQAGRPVSLTARGRVTVEPLRLNERPRVELRANLLAEGLFPPS